MSKPAGDRLEQGAVLVVRRLVEAGFEAYWAGGCVRDRLLGVRPKDYDIATSARPEQVESLFRRTIPLGKTFGTVVVVVKGHEYDVTTFRSETSYADGRHPDSVRFTTAEEDVRRRDFTINALLYDPISDRLLDFVGGREDLRNRCLRTVGDPIERFTEDHLRILRAVRFAARFQLTIDPGTANAMRRLASLAATPSVERQFQELDRMLVFGDPARAVRLLRDFDILQHVVPEAARKASNPPPSRLQRAPDESALDRTISILEALAEVPRPDVRIAWAVLLEDQAPDSWPQANARAVSGTIKRLRGSNELAQGASELVRCRDRALFADRVSRCRERIVAARNDYRHLEVYLEVEANCSPLRGCPPLPPPSTLPEPILTGADLIRVGIPRGPKMGAILRRLRWLQLEGRIDSKESALAWLECDEPPAS